MKVARPVCPCGCGPLRIVALTGVAELCRVNRQRAQQLARRVTFPDPIFEGNGRHNRLWNRCDVERYDAARRVKYRSRFEAYARRKAAETENAPCSPSA